jgi:hypothetical protein
VCVCVCVCVHGALLRSAVRNVKSANGRHKNIHFAGSKSASPVTTAPYGAISVNFTGQKPFGLRNKPEPLNGAVQNSVSRGASI